MSNCLDQASLDQMAKKLKGEKSIWYKLRVNFDFIELSFQSKSLQRTKARLEAKNNKDKTELIAITMLVTDKLIGTKKLLDTGKVFKFIAKRLG